METKRTIPKLSEEFLFNKPQNKKVVAYDLFDNKYKRPLKGFRFRVGAYGILQKGRKILVQKHPLLTKYGLPGGGIDIGEKISDGLFREFKEETGLEIKIKKLVMVGEDMFTYKGEDAQGIFIFYEVEKIGGKLVKKGNGKDVDEANFIELRELNKKNTQRVFWEVIKSLKISYKDKVLK